MRLAEAIAIALFILLTATACDHSGPDEKIPTGFLPDLTDPLPYYLHFHPKDGSAIFPVSLINAEGAFHLFYSSERVHAPAGQALLRQAFSEDLIRWKETPFNLFNDSSSFLSSACIVEYSVPSSISGIPNQPPSLVSLFTVDGGGPDNDPTRYGLAYSSDAGNSWQPAVQPSITIPEVPDLHASSIIFHEPTAQWIMVVAARDHIAFFASGDLANWNHSSDFGKAWGNREGVWRKAELFPVRLGNQASARWVLLVSTDSGHPNGGSGIQYFAGQFDGSQFLLDEAFAGDLGGENSGKGIWLDYGRDLSEGLTAPFLYQGKDEVAFLGRISNTNYEGSIPANHSLSLPRLVFLGPTARGVRLFSQPIPGIDDMRQVTYTLAPTLLHDSMDITSRLGFPTAPMEILLEIELPENGSPDVGFLLSNDVGEQYRIGFDAERNQFYSDRTKAGNREMPAGFANHIHRAPRVQNSRQLRMRVFFSRYSVELFADWGATCITDTFFPESPFNRIKMYTNNGSVRITRGQFFQLKGGN